MVMPRLNVDFDCTDGIVVKAVDWPFSTVLKCCGSHPHITFCVIQKEVNSCFEARCCLCQFHVNF